MTVSGGERPTGCMPKAGVSGEPPSPGLCSQTRLRQHKARGLSLLGRGGEGELLPLPAALGILLMWLQREWIFCLDSSARRAQQHLWGLGITHHTALQRAFPSAPLPSPLLGLLKSHRALVRYPLTPELGGEHSTAHGGSTGPRRGCLQGSEKAKVSSPAPGSQGTPEPPPRQPRC